MKNKYILRLIQTIMTVMIPFAVSGQNLNPTVEVSKTYEGKLMEVDKPYQKMAVPDSVLRFNLDFDYSVTDTPYKGSYEFNPYVMEVAPAPVVSEAGTFFLKAGVGYQLHPVLDLKWSPEFKSPFRMNIYASHKSFVGNYWKMNAVESDDSYYSIDRVAKNHDGARKWFGYDFRTRAGVDGRYDWHNLMFIFDLGYNGILQRDELRMNRSYYTLGAKASVVSKYSDSGLSYRVDAEYLYGEDRLMFPSDGESYIKENGLDIDAAFGYVLDNGHRAMLDFGLDMASTDGAFITGGVDVDIVPHYAIEKERWRFDLGLRISTAFKSMSVSDAYIYGEQVVYPDVRVEYKAIEDKMKLFLDLGGDCGVMSYSDMVRFDGRANAGYGRGIWNVLDVTDEKVNLALGAAGRFGNRFSYDLRLGYANVGNALLEGAAYQAGELVPALGYTSYSRLYGTLEWLLDLESVVFDGALDCNYAYGQPLSRRKGLFFPSVLRGDVSVTYNWKNRLYVGVECDFATDRKGSILNEKYVRPSFFLARIPGYADLGVNAEYLVNRKLSVWLKGGNLLGMTIQRSLMYAEKGPYFTAGVSLNL